MTPTDALDVIQVGILAVSGALAWSIRSAFKGGSWVTDQELRIKALEYRMDRAGKQTSDLASEVQGLHEQARKEFVTLREFDTFREDTLRDHHAIWAAVRPTRGTR